MGIETNKEPSGPAERFPAWRDAGEATAAVALVDRSITAEAAATTATAPIDVVSSGPVSATRRRDVQPDTGWGRPEILSEEELALAKYKREKLAKILGNRALPPNTEVMWGAHVSYAGEGPEPSFRRPGYRGEVVYTQDNSQPPAERMAASIAWTAIESMPNAPA